MQFKPLDVIEMSAQYYELDTRWSPPIGRSRRGGGYSDPPFEFRRCEMQSVKGGREHTSYPNHNQVC